MSLFDPKTYTLSDYTRVTDTTVSRANDYNWRIPSAEEIFRTSQADDITVNGRSLAAFMESVEQQLAILNRCAELESRWLELKELGEQYKKLQKELQEREYTFELLKKKSEPK